MICHLLDLVKVIPPPNVNDSPRSHEPLCAKVCVLKLCLLAKRLSSEAVAKDDSITISYWQAHEDLSIYWVHSHHLK